MGRVSVFGTLRVTESGVGQGESKFVRFQFARWPVGPSLTATVNNQLANGLTQNGTRTNLDPP
jgi:hypothetical protein